jgi:hypothetical protein
MASAAGLIGFGMALALRSAALIWGWSLPGFPAGQGAKDG